MQSRERSRKNYDGLSRYYDLLAGGSERHLRRLGLDALCAQPGETILEVGCGTGAALSSVAGQAGKVIGIDLSQRMAEIALRRIQPLANGLVGVADAAFLPFPAACFDAAWTAFTLELFAAAECQVILAELRRTLKPAARLGAVALQASRQPGGMERLYLAAHRRFPEWIDCCPMDLPAALRTAGFQVEISREYSLWGLPVCIAVGRC